MKLEKTLPLFHSLSNVWQKSFSETVKNIEVISILYSVLLTCIFSLPFSCLLSQFDGLFDDMFFPFEVPYLIRPSERIK